MDRRSLLKLAGVTAMGGALGASGNVDVASAAPTVVQEDGYEVWKISGTEVYELGDGETLENVLIDQTEPGANFYITAPNNPSGWAIRNVAWRGLGTVSNVSGYAGLFHMTVSGNGVIENVFVDNRDPNRDTEIGGVLLPQHHSGTVECRNTFIAGCGNNAFYGSNPGKSGGNEGTVEFYNCYHRDNTVSQFRVGTPGSLVENCVGVVDDPGGTRGTYPNTSSRRARGVWVRNMPGNTVRNSVMYVAPDDDDPWANFMVDCIGKSNGPEAAVSLENTRVNPDAPRHTFLPQRDCPARIDGEFGTANLSVNVIGDGGVPLSPEMAARGERAMPPELSGGDGRNSGDESGSDLERTLTVDGTDADWTDYEIAVNGDIEKDADVGSANDADEIDGSTVAGFVNGGVDGFRFSGEVTDATVDGDATVLVDGQAIDVDGGTIADRTLTVDGSGNRTDYAFAVSEALEAASGVGTGDEIDGTAASGFVVGGADQYRFAGEVTDVSLDGDATVLVDGEPFDAAPDLPNHIVFDGRDTDGESNYQIAVSGELESDPLAGGVDDGVIEGSAANGTVVDDRDGFRFSGDLTKLTLDGNANIVFEDNDG